VTSRAWMLRLAALMGAGTFGLHQARYLLGYGGDAGHALHGQGHGYLGPLGPLLVGALLPLAAELIRRVAAGQAAPAPRFRRLWLGAAVGLALAYALQESIEGLLSSGHASGIAAITAHGGWVALPLALAIGFVIALLLRGASRAAAAAASSSRRPWRAPAPAPPATVAPAFAAAVTARLAPFASAARGPPPPAAA
jgi:hypothetical protein